MIRKMVLLSLVVAIVAAVLVLLISTGCHRCKKQTMRCSGEVVQLCAPDGRWKTVVDCSKLKRTKKKYVCTKISEERCSCRAEKINGQP